MTFVKKMHAVVLDTRYGEEKTLKRDRRWAFKRLPIRFEDTQDLIIRFSGGGGIKFPRMSYPGGNSGFLNDLLILIHKYLPPPFDEYFDPFVDISVLQ